MPGSHGFGGVLGFLAALALCLLLDWITFTPAFAPFGIPPWNPPIGLALAAVLVNGFRFLPLLLIAPLIDDIAVRDLPFPWYVSALEACITGLGYAIAVWLLRRGRRQASHERPLIRDLAVLLGTLSAAALIIAVLNTLLLQSSSVFPDRYLLTGVLRYWIADVIGIFVVLPFILFVWQNRSRPVLTLEHVLQLFAILGAITIVFGLAGQTRLHFSYVLFLPVMWAAVRSGLSGAATGLMITQIGIMIALHLTGDQPSHVPAFQVLMSALAVSGLIIGALIEERKRIDMHMRRQQDAIARAARIGTLGHVTTSFAHEVNQPLAAGLNFNRIVLHELNEAPPNFEAARGAAQNALQQIERGSQIIRRLRNFIQVGRLETGVHSLADLIEESVALVRPDLERIDAVPEIDIPGQPIHVAVDSLQIAQVLVNLLRNAVEAIEETGRRPEITVAAKWTGGPFVEVLVSDNGPGFPPSFDLKQGASLESSKPSGLGIGLSLCHSIVAAHGGALTIESTGPQGSTLKLTLPMARKPAHA